MRELVTCCVVVVLVVAIGSTAQANWSETFGGNAFDLPTWLFRAYPELTGSFTATIQDGPDDDDYISIDETNPAPAGGSQFGVGIGDPDDIFSDVRVGAVFNVTGDVSWTFHGLSARTSYFIDDGSISGYSGIIASCYALLIHYEDGPANLRLELVKVVNLSTEIMQTWQPEVPVPGADHARSRYVELDVVGSDPVYITGSIYEYKGGPLLVRTPTFIDTSANDPWERPGIHDDVFASGASGIFATNQEAEPVGYHSTFDSVSSVSDGPAAVCLSPADGAIDVSRDADLSWVEAAFATSRELWFGKEGAMQKVVPAPAGTTYDPGTLDYGQVYEWRVDEIGPGVTVTGHVWRFRTEYVVVDGFEDYNDYSDRIFYTWRDGYGFSGYCGNYTGAMIGHPSPPFAEQGIVHGGQQSMPYFYNNTRSGTNYCNQPITFAYSEATAHTAGPNSLNFGTDWTIEGVKSLSLWFYGDADNVVTATDRMYVVLEDGPGTEAVVQYDGDVNDIKDEKWQEWNIDLADFTGVHKDDVQAISIGFGVRGSTAPTTGKGVVFFDDITLRRPRCLPEFKNPTASFDNDCMVDFDDLRILVDDWLFGPGGNGLWYEYYEGNWDALPDFDAMVPVRQGPVNNFDISLRLQGDYFGFRFTGKISIATAGNYTFYTTSDDGSRLFIGDTMVVDNDGLHGMQEKSGTIGLTAGQHPITVLMFEKGGGQGLVVEYEGPGIARQVIPDGVLYRLPSATDLNGDGTVDLLDYAVLAEEWLIKQLWP